MTERLLAFREQLKLNKKVHVGLTLLAVLLLLCLALFKWYLPQYILLKETTEGLQIEIDQIQSNYTSPQELEQTLRIKRRQLEEQLLPFQWQVLHGEPLLVLANQANVNDKEFKITSLYQGDAEQRDNIWSVPFIIQARGKEQSVNNYLYYLDQEPKAMVPYRMRLSYNDVQDRVSRDKLELEIELELAALGIEMQLGQLPTDPESSRGEIFSPTVALPIGDWELEEVIESGETIGQSQPRTPSYSFPSKKEVRP